MNEFCETLTPREYVRLKHPTAFCESNGLDYRVVVFFGGFAGVEILGVGSNRRLAWANAATRVQAQAMAQR